MTINIKDNEIVIDNKHYIAVASVSSSGGTCPDCLSNNTRVYDVRSKVRKRECMECGSRWITKELIVARINKRGGKE